MTGPLFAVLFAAATTLAANPVPATLKDSAMTHRVQGRFDVTLNPQVVEDPADAAFVGRMGFDKRFHGDLDATSKGVMLFNHSPVEGSGAYVAIETVTGTLGGREGSFVFQHNCHRDGNGQQQSITVVPDSGTGALAGLRGSLTINIVDGAHFYDFTYSLPGDG